ncbi:MAG: SIMPL domain-containing protein [Gammaproteobacteria bacterium]|nr:SIMPL domain-containing protein [Gammaproteobacteria bacterium]
MSNYKYLSVLISAILISLGIFSAGFYIGKGLHGFRDPSHFVTVKGIAERNVKSDLGVWQINYHELGDNLMTVNQQLQHDQTIVIQFLTSHGFKNNELFLQPAKVEDRLTGYQSSEQKTKIQRYVVTSGILVRSQQVDLIDKTNALTGLLLQQGVPISFNTNPYYYFTQLDALRPAMMADATHSARLVAEQFAKDASTRLGSIQHASQGLFQFMSRDAMSTEYGDSALSSIYKKIRLVTTIDYQLKR